MFATSKLVISPDWRSALRARQLDRFDALWNIDGELVKRANNTEVLHVILDGHIVFVKRIVRGAARAEFENLQQLRAWNLDAPAPIAYGERRVFGWLRRSLVATEGIVDPMPLDSFIRDVLPKRPELRRELLERLANHVQRLHAHQFAHRDLYWRNIVLSRRALSQFYLLNSHEGRVWNRHREHEARALDLATLDAAAPSFFRRTERLRFLLCYFGRPRLDEQIKAVAWLALAAAEPMRKRELARIRETQR